LPHHLPLDGRQATHLGTQPIRYLLQGRKEEERVGRKEEDGRKGGRKEREEWRSEGDFYKKKKSDTVLAQII
jgi:hypothetical protein